MEQQSLIVAGLLALAVAGVMYAFVYPYLSGDIKAQKRVAAAATSSTTRAGSVKNSDPAKRRKMIAESLKEAGAQNKNRKLTLEQRIAQAGVIWSRQAFLAGSVGVGLVFATVLFMLNGDPLVALGAGVVGAFGLPNWVLSFLRKRRIAKFVEAFPGAVDIIIRGVKAGLPVGECFSAIASEAQEPVRSEFRLIVESSAVGLSIGEATDRFAERVPVADASFFSTVINIQAKSGGNLSEALSNLSSVLRARKAMKQKIQAMSAEAKASAGIIGSLPFLVGGAVYFMTPDYMLVLFTTTPGKIVLAGGLIWMFIGCVIMRQMINFDF